jgi:hypothetical protein
MMLLQSIPEYDTDRENGKQKEIVNKLEAQAWAGMLMK